MIRLSTSLPNERKRVTPAAVLSIGLHVVLVIVLMQALRWFPSPLAAFFPGERSREERLTYVGVRPTNPPVARGRVPATLPPAATVVVPPRATPLPAPREVPTGIPRGPSGVPANLGPTTGPAVGGQGPTRGVQPTYVDPRVWVSEPPLEPAAKSDEERLDSAVFARIKAHNDSLVANRYTPNKFERGDWTVERGGGKYGIDPQFIRLGKFSIPTALLALLPINGGPGASARELQQNPALAVHRGEIIYQAQRAITHDEFRRAVKQLRLRKDRERREKEEKTVAKKPVAPS